MAKKSPPIIVAVMGFVLVLAVIGIAGTGYVKNVIKLTELDFVAPYKAETIRVIGLFPPVGAVAGYMDIEDGQK